MRNRLCYRFHSWMKINRLIEGLGARKQRWLTVFHEWGMLKKLFPQSGTCFMLKRSNEAELGEPTWASRDVRDGLETALINRIITPGCRTVKWIVWLGGSPVWSIRKCCNNRGAATARQGWGLITLMELLAKPAGWVGVKLTMVKWKG